MSLGAPFSDVGTRAGFIVRAFDCRIIMSQPEKGIPFGRYKTARCALDKRYAGSLQSGHYLLKSQLDDVLHREESDNTRLERCGH